MGFECLFGTVVLRVLRGMSVRAIAQQLGIGSRTVVRALKDFAGQSDPVAAPPVRGPVLVMPKASGADLEQQP